MMNDLVCIKISTLIHIQNILKISLQMNDPVHINIWTSPFKIFRDSCYTCTLFHLFLFPEITFCILLTLQNKMVFHLTSLKYQREIQIIWSVQYCTHISLLTWQSGNLRIADCVGSNPIRDKPLLTWERNFTHIA
jgi:hypothetical protein